MTMQSSQSQGAVRRRPPPRIVEVRAVTRLTPRMVRITFGGEQMEGFNSKGPAEHVRIFLPDNETGELLLPDTGTGGKCVSGRHAPRQPRVHAPSMGLCCQ